MKTDEFKKNSYMKIFAATFLIIAFVVVFTLLTNKHTTAYGDIIDISFNYQTIEGKQLVVRDKSAINPKFYVLFFNLKDNTYLVHEFNYYETGSQYDLEYHRLFDNILDYNINDNMLRINLGQGYGNYNNVKNNIASILNITNYEIY